MNDSLFVRGREAVGDLLPIFHGFARWNWPSVEQVAKAVTLQQFGDQVRHAVLRADVEDRKNIGMVQGGDSARFLLETPHPFGISRECLRQNLDRNIPTESRVPGAVDFPHATRAYGRNDFVGTEFGAERKRHIFRIQFKCTCSKSGLGLD